MPTANWSDGLEGFLAGNGTWPAYMNDVTGKSVTIVSGEGRDRTP